MAAVLTFDAAAFRAFYPQYSNEQTYPTATLQGYWDAATCFISDRNCGYLKGDCRVKAIWLMMVHLLTIAATVTAGDTPGQVQSATIDKVSVSLTPPPIPNQWQWWLGTTPSGAQLLALLQVNSAGGMYIGAAPEIQSIRKGGGLF